MDTVQVVLAFERPEYRDKPIQAITWTVYDEAGREVCSGLVEPLGWSTSQGMLEVAIGQVRRHLRPFLG